MNSRQLFDAISNGDMTLEGFQAWLHELFMHQYLEGYTDAHQNCAINIEEE